MKNTILFLSLVFSLLVFGFSVNSANASNCASGDVFNSVTGQRCSIGTTSTSSANLGVGSRGNEVRAIQQILKNEGYSIGTIDGSYGKRTARAVREFQDDNDLPVTGVVDAVTRAVLNVFGGVAVSPTTPASGNSSGTSSPSVPSGSSSAYGGGSAYSWGATSPTTGSNIYSSTCSTSGYDSNTGFRCGCTSISGYSLTTGLPCGGGEIKSYSSLSASCQGENFSGTKTMRWITSVGGGTGSYKYAWSAYNDVSGYVGGSTSSPYFDASYSSTGIKQALVRVSDSTGSSVSATCSAPIPDQTTSANKPTLSSLSPSSGGSNQIINAYGTGFTQSSIVLIGDNVGTSIPAYVSADGTNLRFVFTTLSLPTPHTSMYSIRVSNVGNVSAASNLASNSLMYSVNTSQSVATPLAVSCSAIAYPDFVKISWNASASGGSGSYNYSWNAYNDVTGYPSGSTTSSSFTASYSSIGTKEATVRVTDSSGSSVSANCSSIIYSTASSSVFSPTLSTYSWRVNDASTWPTVSTSSFLNSGQAMRVKGLGGEQYFEKTLGVNSGKITSSPPAGTTNLILYVYDYARGVYATSEKVVNVNIQ